MLNVLKYLKRMQIYLYDLLNKTFTLKNIKKNYKKIL